MQKLPVSICSAQVFFATDLNLIRLTKQIAYPKIHFKNPHYQFGKTAHPSPSISLSKTVRNMVEHTEQMRKTAQTEVRQIRRSVREKVARR